MKEITSIDLSLTDRMKTLNLHFHFHDDITETLSFDCNKAFKDGKFKNTYIKNCTRSVLEHFHPGKAEIVFDYILTLRKLTAVCNHLIDDERVDDFGHDITEDLLTQASDFSLDVFGSQIKLAMPALDLYYKTIKCFKSFI